MLRFTLQKQLSQGLGKSRSLAWAPRNAKQVQRYSKEALQLSRQRYHLQKENQRIRQSINLNHSEYSKLQGKSREALIDTAYTIIHQSSRSKRHHTTQEYRRPQDRADNLATARYLLMLQEAKRREMQRGRTQRLEAFRNEKRSGF